VPLERPRPPSRALLLTLLTDRPLYMEWHNATVAWAEAQLSQRNALGLAPKLLLPLVAAFAALGFLYWPKDGDLSKLAKLMNPAGMVDFARQTSGTFCTGPSYPDGKCSTDGAPSAKQSSPFRQIGPAAGGIPTSNRGADHWPDTSGTLASKLMPLLFLSLVGLGLFRPKLLRKLFGQIEPLEIVRSKPVETTYGKPVEAAYVKPPEVEPSKPRWAEMTGEEMIARSQQLAQREQLARREQPSQAEQPRWRAPPSSPQSAPVFGRRRG
jgi:heat shock protein HtpX